MKILHEETIGGVRYRLHDDGFVVATEVGRRGFVVLLNDGSRVGLPFREDLYTTAESFRARNWDRLRPLAENEQRTDDGNVRQWEWRGDEFGSQLTTDPEFRPLSFWVWAKSAAGDYARAELEFGLALARKNCPPHLAVRDDGTIYRMAEDEARRAGHTVVKCSWWGELFDGYPWDPGQRERVEAWRARQVEGEEAVEALLRRGVATLSGELKELEAQAEDADEYMRPGGAYQRFTRKTLELLAEKPPSFEIDGTTYYRADHPRVLRGDEFRWRRDNFEGIDTFDGCYADDESRPEIMTGEGDFVSPWHEEASDYLPPESIAAARAYWLANYQFAPGEYLDEEAGVVRRREPEPEPKKPEPFFTDSHGDVWEFVKFRQGWHAVFFGPDEQSITVKIRPCDHGPVAEALRAYVERLRVDCENMHCPAPFKPKFKVEHGGHCACDVEPTKGPLP